MQESIPFPVPARQTGRADFPHPAFRQASLQAHASGARWLRLAVQPLRKHPESAVLSGSRQSPLLCFFRGTLEVRVLSSTGVTRLPRYYNPLRLPELSVPYGNVEAVTSSVPDLPLLPRLPCPHAVLITPVESIRCYRRSSRFVAAFPEFVAGRLPLHYFRGLLKLHSRYGLRTCSLAFRELSHEASASIRLPLLISYLNRLLSGWVLPPLAVDAVEAHTNPASQTRNPKCPIGLTRALNAVRGRGEKRIVTASSRQRVAWAVQSDISGFGFEMQDSFDFRFRAR